MTVIYKRNKPKVGKPRTQSEFCSVEDCGLPSHVKNYCRRHYSKFKKYGNPIQGKVFTVNNNKLSEELGISRQRVEQLRHPDRSRARKTLKYAVSTGRILKPLVCMGCDSTEPLEGHHERYDWPLCVIWLCKNCHVKWH